MYGHLRDVRWTDYKPLSLQGGGGGVGGFCSQEIVGIFFTNLGEFVKNKVNPTESDTAHSVLLFLGLL